MGDWAAVRRRGPASPWNPRPAEQQGGCQSVLPWQSEEMEPSKRPGALQHLKEHLCRETDPSKLYKTLKKLSSLPMLGDSLEEIGFRQTIKLLKKEQLLVPFARDLAACWSETCHHLEPQPVPETPRDNAEDKPHEPASPEGTEDEGKRPLSSKSEAPSCALGLHQQLPPPLPNSPSPAPGQQQRPPLLLRLKMLPCKRKKTGLWKVEIPSLEKDVPPGESERCQDNPDRPAASPLPQVASSVQDGFQLPFAEPSSMHPEQEVQPWACRRNSRMPDCSGACALARRPVLQKSQAGGLAESDPTRKKPLQTKQEEAEPQQPEDKCLWQSQAGKPTDSSQSESKGHFHLQDSRCHSQRPLQALVAPLQSTGAKKPQGGQAKMIAFTARDTRPGQQADPGPGVATSWQKHSQTEASAHRLPQGALLQPSGRQGSAKIKAQKPAPLMAKALRDYKRRFSGR